MSNVQGGCSKGCARTFFLILLIIRIAAVSAAFLLIQPNVLGVRLNFTESVGFEPTCPERTTAFRVRLVMTTSITLQLNCISITQIAAFLKSKFPLPSNFFGNGFRWSANCHEFLSGTQPAEELREHLAALFLQNSPGHFHLMVKFRHFQHIQHRTGAASL